MRKYLSIVALTAGLASSQNVTFQSPLDRPTQVPPVRPFRLPPRIGVFVEAPLSLNQALAMALKNNKDIEASRIDQQEAEYNVVGAQGAFDPVIGGSGFWEKQISPVASSLSGSSTGSLLNQVWQADPSVSGSTPWYGGSYRIDFSNQRVFTNNTFITLNPQYSTALNLQYTQPLARGLRYDGNRHAISVAKKNRNLTDQQFRQRVMSVAQLAEQAYWELVYAYNNLQVQLEAVNIARQQDESNRRQQEQGLLAPIDVVAAQTQLATFELNAYSAQAAVTQAENSLKTLILPDRDSPLWPSALIPSTPPATEPPLTPLPDAVREALANRPEVAINKIAGQINQDDVRLYHDLTKPQVDLVGTYSLAGLAGPLATQGANPLTAAFGPLVDRLNTLSAEAGLDPINLGAFSTPTPPGLVGGYGQSLNGLFANNFPTTEVQLRVSLPIRNRTAEANLSRSLAETHRIRNQKEQVEQAVEADVRNALQVVQSAQMRLGAAQVARESAEEQYNSEQRQFRAGTSTLFLVQQRQSTMITARSQERRAESDLAEAIASYELATASILDAHNISLR